MSQSDLPDQNTGATHPNTAEGPDETGMRLAALAALPGFDIQCGLSVVRGKPAKYIELLQSLVAEHAMDMQRMGERLAANNMADALRIVHNLKGTAATLGALRLSEDARRLEMALRIAADAPIALAPLQAYMEAITDDFSLLSAALQSPLVCPARAGGTGSTAGTDPQHLGEILDTLNEQLEAGDYAAADFFEEHAELLGLALGSSCREIQRSIRKFDFKAAQEALQALRGTAGNSPAG